MFRMTGTGDAGVLADDETFADALRTHFGDDVAPAADAPDAAPDSALSDTEVEPVAAPSGESDGGDGPSPLPSSPSVDDGGFVDEPMPEAPAEPVPDATPDAAPAAEPDFDLNELFERYYGTRPSPQQMTALLSFVDQVQRLDPNQQAALNAILSGQNVAPSQAPAQASFTPQARPQAPSAPPAQPQVAFDDLTPEARAILEPIYAQQQEIVARLQAQEVQSAQAQLQAQEQAIVAGIQAASNSFVADMGSALTPTDLVILESRAQQSGQFPLFMTQHGNDAARAYRSLLETLAYSDPVIRAKLVSAAPPVDTPADSARKSRAAAVSAGGVAGNRVSPLSPNDPVATPTDPAAARDWAINEISRATGLPRMT